MKRTFRRAAFGILVVLLAPVGVAHAQPLCGPVVAWGGNADGQCTLPSPNADFAAVSGGWYHSLGLKSDGSIVTWGSNASGQCNVPTPNAGFTAVVAGVDYSLGLKADGSIVAWGGNDYGQCNVPAPNSGFTAVAAGYYFNLGLRADGSIAGWGNNNFRQCVVPSPNTGFVAVAPGGFHGLGLKPDGSIVAWGRNDQGQCNLPTPNSGFAAVRAGIDHSVGLKVDGSIVAWGSNEFSQRTVPAPNTGFMSVAVGPYFNLGLRTDGSIIAWGGNTYGQCAVPTPNTGFTAVAAGRFHSLAVQGESPVATYLTSFTADRHDGEVLVRWVVSQPVAGIVFHLWREEPGRERICLDLTPLSGRTAYDFIDPTPPAGPADYWLQEVDADGAATWYGPAHLRPASVPTALRLYPVAPNPFNPRTTIRFDLPRAESVRLAVYAVSGRLVRVLVEGERPAGSHEAVWDGTDITGRAMASGSYLARLEAGGKAKVVRMGLVR